MKQFPKSISLPSNGKILSFEVYQRGNINERPTFKEKVVVPTGKKDVDIYRTLAYECMHISNSLYRENVTVEVKNRTRPIRLDAILVINQEFYLMDTIVKISDIPNVKRYCKSILSSVSEISNILLLIKTNLIKRIDFDNWITIPHIVDIGE